MGARYIAYIVNKEVFGEAVPEEDRVKVGVPGKDLHTGELEYEEFELPYNEVILYERKEHVGGKTFI